MFPPPQSPYNSGRGWQTKTSLHHHQGKFTDIVLTPTLNHHLFNYTSKTKVTSLTTSSPSGSISAPHLNPPASTHMFISYKLHLEPRVSPLSPLSPRVFCLIVLNRQTIIRNGFIINETPDDTIYNDNFQRVIFPIDLSLIAWCRNEFSLSREEESFPIHLTL